MQRRLLAACASHDRPSRESLASLLAQGASCRVADKAGMSPLHLVAYFGDVPLADLLLAPPAPAAPASRNLKV